MAFTLAEKDLLYQGARLSPRRGAGTTGPHSLGLEEFEPQDLIRQLVLLPNAREVEGILQVSGELPDDVFVLPEEPRGLEVAAGRREGS